MKQKKRGWIWLAALLVIVFGGAAFLLPILLPTGELNLTQQQYRAEKVSKGDIQVTVHGTGSIEAMDTSSVAANATGTVEQLLVDEGDAVKAGQLIAMLDDDAINTQIDALKEQIITQDATIASLRAMPGAKYLTAPVDCRVKAIYAKQGEDTNVSMSKQGALMVLSTDGKMKVSFTPSEGAAITAGAPVKFIIGKTQLDGFITTVPDSTSANAEAVINDDSIPEGRVAVIKGAKGVELGRGPLEINRPLLVTATTGKVDKIYVKAGATVKAGKRLVRLTGNILNPEFEAQLVKRQQLQDDLDQAYDDLKDLSITAPVDGIVTKLAIEQKGTVQEGMTVCKIEQISTFKLVIAVDELDIPKIAIGQKAQVKIDALPGQEATGEVVKIAPIGLKANDVTTYDVTLRLTSPTGTLTAMSASADIEVASKTGVLLVPVEAVHTVNGKSWVYGAMSQDIRDGQGGGNAGSRRGGLQAMFSRGNGAKQAERPTVAVTVGLVSDTWAEILSGLNEGDEVAVPVSQSSAANMMGFGGMGRQASQGGGNGSGD